VSWLSSVFTTVTEEWATAGAGGLRVTQTADGRSARTKIVAPRDNRHCLSARPSVSVSRCRPTPSKPGLAPGPDVQEGTHRTVAWIALLSAHYLLLLLVNCTITVSLTFKTSLDPNTIRPTCDLQPLWQFVVKKSDVARPVYLFCILGLARGSPQPARPVPG